MTMIGYDPEFFDKLDIDEIIFVLVHEVMHKALMHGLRRLGRNPRLWNIACDYAINWILKEAGFKLPDLAKIFNDPRAGACINKRFANMSAEQIYEILQKEQESERKKGRGDPQHPTGLEGDLHEPEGADDPVEVANIERRLQGQVAQAANMARMAGKLPGGLEQLINDILNPTQPWEDLLREFMTRVVHDDESWNRRNRRFRGVYLPRRWGQRMGEVLYIGDTSGSVSNEELNKGAAEVMSISHLVKPERIRVLWADTRVAREDVFELGDEIVFNAAGGGGTDMRVPLEYAEQHEPDVVIMCTDGHTPWPDREPPYPLIVLCTTDVSVPIGQVIRI